MVAIGETGWPTTGSTTGAAVPSVRNLQIYWNTVGCRLIRQRLPWVWFEGRDEPQKTGALGVEPHWGLAFVGLAEKIELHC